MGFIVIILTVLALILVAAFGCYRITFFVPRKEIADIHYFPEELHYGNQADKIHALINAVMKLKSEDVFVQSKDNLQLHGKLYFVSEEAPTEILFHGYRSFAERDFSGGLQLALSLGHNALLVDQRAHGQSQGKALSFGILERYDCMTWINYVQKRFGKDKRIILVGISMGAATVLMAGGLPLPENVAGIIADCGYSAPSEIIKKVAKERHFPVWLVYPLIRLGGKIFGGFDIEEETAEKALKRCFVPVLLIHGEDDGFVPCEMSRLNYAACAGKKRLETFPGAEHGLSYLVDQERYQKIITEFCNEIIK